jgi:hypothetical protein
VIRTSLALPLTVTTLLCPAPALLCSDAEAEEAEGPPGAIEVFISSYSLALAPDPLLCASTAHPFEGQDRDFEPDRPGQQYQRYNWEAKAVPQDVFLAVGLDSLSTDLRRPRFNLSNSVSRLMDCCFTRQDIGPESAASLAQRPGAGAGELRVHLVAVRGG